MAEPSAHPQPLRIHLSQPPRERGPAVVSCHAERDRVMDVFRVAITRDAPPSVVALPTMQEAVKPQKQTVLVQDENQLLENGLRSLLQELVGAAVAAGESVMQYGNSIDEADDRGHITRLLDIVLFLCERGHVEGGMVFQLLEDLTEVSTIKDCREVFGYIESKQETLGKAELFGRGKLVMLRTCNQLLRRLSKANDVVFCGRILMFLAHFFPLSERSAVNIKGIFNTSNETKYEREPPSDGFSQDFNFYRTFWGLQEYFCNPTVLLQHGTKWQNFSSSLEVVLSTFEAQPLAGDDDESSSRLDEGDNTAYNIKYLTSSKLMSLELKDPGFRRHILVQCLIIFDYLKSPSKSDKEGPRDILREEVKSLEERVNKLLEITPPRGKEFLASIEHILEREQNWVWWKRDGCLPFERFSSEKKSSQDQPKKRKTRWRLGNKELSQLWRWADQNPDALTDGQRVKMPPMSEYWKPLADDMDVTAGIEPEYHHKNNRVYCWKGLRFAARQDLDAFCRFTDHGVEGVVPPELLPPDIRGKLYGKTADKAKQRSLKKEEDKASNSNAEDSKTQGSGHAEILDDGPAPNDLEDATAMDADVFVANPSGAPTPDESQKQGSDTEGLADETPSAAGSPEVAHDGSTISPTDSAAQKAQVAVADSAISKPPRKRAHVET